jgi:ethanolamine utilization microcompartment shell protein EutL
VGKLFSREGKRSKPLLGGGCICRVAQSLLDARKIEKRMRSVGIQTGRIGEEAFGPFELAATTIDPA